MIGWMLYCVIVTIVVAGAARAAESLARLSGYRMRWVWFGALALTAFLAVSSAIQRFERHAPVTLVATVRDDVTPSVAVGPTWMQLLRSVVGNVERGVDGSLAFAARSIDRTVSPAATTYTTLAWVVASLGLAAIFTAIIYRFQRARRHWPLSRVQNVPVRISPSVGPIVIGLVRPEIIVPRWLLDLALDEQQLAVAHEQEHLRARDPMLLGFGWLVIILAPWNPASWYMLSRLRLAIELDCDARVLRRGAAPRAYGSLLIEVAQNASPLTLSALGFADESSQLYQRILALRGPAASFARTRAVGAAMAAAAGVLVACRITPPSQPMVVPTPAVHVQDVARISPIQSVPSQKVAVVDAGVSQPTPRPARRARAVPMVERDSVVSPVTMIDPAPVLPTKDAAARVIVHLDSVASKGEPMLLIDGVRSTFETMNRLDPKTIEHVEVVKGSAAIAEYGADAQQGVITITTKRPSPPR